MNRRFQVGSKPPQVPVDAYSFEKRNSVDLLRAQPVCPYKTEWRLIHRAKNINDTEVIVFQPEIESDGFQWFYTATCDRAASYLYDSSCPTCCRGIDTTRYVSTCVPKKSYIMAYARQAQELNYDWTWIQIDTGCSCAISSIPGV
ncbi:venom nerve growth factor-like [Saccostrea echinata]|uniref:venom nerve growth factor-like n=1 Tax=Saccostrea echinata TaxID=191078 RepID=UPI002A7EEE21|nr:venom nerve growth factor-like [Saccostrea echinata]